MYGWKHHYCTEPRYIDGKQSFWQSEHVNFGIAGSAEQCSEQVRIVWLGVQQLVVFEAARSELVAAVEREQFNVRVVGTELYDATAKECRSGLDTIRNASGEKGNNSVWESERCTGIN